MHLERLEEVELVRKEMWRQYHLEQDPFKKARILKLIIELQPYASAFAEATAAVLAGEVIPAVKEPATESFDISKF
jgi:hypothetical protein